MDDTLHYLIMANQMLVQKALLEQLKDTGLTIGQPKILDYLKEHDIPGVCGVDTRAISLFLREHGCLGGMITTNPNFNLDEILPRHVFWKRVH